MPQFSAVGQFIAINNCPAESSVDVHCLAMPDLVDGTSEVLNSEKVMTSRSACVVLNSLENISCELCCHNVLVLLGVSFGEIARCPARRLK